MKASSSLQSPSFRTPIEKSTSSKISYRNATILLLPATTSSNTPRLVRQPLLPARKFRTLLSSPSARWSCSQASDAMSEETFRTPPASSGDTGLWISYTVSAGVSSWEWGDTQDVPSEWCADRCGIVKYGVLKRRVRRTWGTPSSTAYPDSELQKSKN